MRHALEVWHLSGSRDPQKIVDADGVDALVDTLLASPASHSMVQVFSLAREIRPSGFPDHEVLVGVDPERLVGLIAFADGTVGNVVTDSQSNSRERAVYHVGGEQRVFPSGSEVPIDLVRQALKELLSSGGRIPTCVKWKEDDDMPDEEFIVWPVAE